MTQEDLHKDIKSCVSCGRCLAVCPVYEISGREGLAPRGKLALLDAEFDGRAHMKNSMKDLLSHCLLCGACAEVCVNEVQADRIIMEGRNLALKGRGLAGLKRMLARDLMIRGPLTGAALKSKRLFIKKLPPESGLHFRFPMPGLDPGRWLPSLTDTPFLDRESGLDKQAGAGPKVALFVGCVGNYLKPSTAEAAVKVLQAAGCEVVLEKSQGCCGKPALGAGDRDTAILAAKKNINAFQKSEYDYLVSFCGTCSEQLKAYAHLPELHLNPGWQEQVLDINEFLIDVLNWRPQPHSIRNPGLPDKVFYHDPCHLARKQGIKSQPRDLIESLGIKLVAADAPPECCGYGGLFNLWHYDLSKKLFQKRAESFINEDPELAITSCSGCILQFEDGLRGMGSEIGVLSLMELLADAL